jgi:hypothetical protein
MEQLPLNSPVKLPRLNQCYLCKEWHLEKDLQIIEVPDQAGWVEKKACEKCLLPIVGENKPVSP